MSLPELRAPYSGPLHLVMHEPGQQRAEANGVLNQLYIDARHSPDNPAGYADGMSLACALTRRPLFVVNALYNQQREQEGFSPLAFWNENFDTPNPDAIPLPSTNGLSMVDYARVLRREVFLRRAADQKMEGPDCPDIWLPYDYLVAGGRFEHAYNWDSYLIAKGHAADGEWGQVLNIADNMEYQVNRFGYVLNGNAQFFSSRSQPPFFGHVVRMLAEQYGDEALIRYLPTLEKEYEYWAGTPEDRDALPQDGRIHTDGSLVRLPDGSLLNRYWDDEDTPRLESYKEDVELGERVAHGLTGEAREKRLGKLYRDLRAGAAGGWDYTSRNTDGGPTLETINTTDILSPDLNSLLAYNEGTIARAHEAVANTAKTEATRERHLEKAAMYRERARRRVAAINKYHWDSRGRIYRDYNFVQGRQVDVESAAMAYPLYTGISTREQCLGVAARARDRFLQAGGFMTTLAEGTEHQWDGDNVWAPPSWAFMRGLARAAYMHGPKDGRPDPELLELAIEGREATLRGLQAVYDKHGVMGEKHRARTLGELGNGGEYKVVTALAMTSELAVAATAWNPGDPYGCLPMGRLALATA